MLAVVATLNSIGAFRPLSYGGDASCTLLTAAGDADFVGLEDIAMVRTGRHAGVAVAGADHRHAWMPPAQLFPLSAVNHTHHMLYSQHPMGALYSLDMNKPRPTPRRLALHGYPYKDFHPHGLSLLEHDDRILLFVVNHRRAGDHVDVFELDLDRGTATYLYGTTHDAFREVNNVHAVSPTEVYITNWLHYKIGTTQNFVEMLGQRPWGTVVHCTGLDAPIAECHPVVSHLFTPNGITGPASGAHVYIAADGQVNVYQRSPDTGELRLQRSVPIDTVAVDNIDLHPSGDVTVSTHPSMPLFFAHAMDRSATPPLSPTEVYRIPHSLLHPGDEDEGGAAAVVVVRVMLHDGSKLSCGAAALEHGGRYLVGAIFAPGALVCDTAGAGAGRPVSTGDSGGGSKRDGQIEL